MLTHAISHSDQELDTHDLSRRRAKVLSELVRIFTQDNNPIGLAEAAVELVKRATEADSVFVYFWDEEVGGLELRIVTSADVDRGFDHVVIPMGIGITGWSAQTQRSVILERDIGNDPRWVSFEDIQENNYQSLIAVPIRDTENLYGVFALYSEQEAKFGAQELAIAEEVGGLLASGLERAERIQTIQSQSATARFLLDFPSAAMTSRTAALQEISRKVLGILNCDACVIDYVPWLGATPDPVIFAVLQERQTEPRVWLTHSRHVARESIDRFETQYQDHRNVSLGFGTSRGILTCYRNRKFSPTELERLNVLATQVGILLESVGSTSLGMAAMSRLMTAHNDAEVSTSLTELGWGSKPFVSVMVEVEDSDTEMETITRTLRETASHTLPGNILIAGSGAMLLLLIEVDSKRLPDQFTTMLTEWLNGVNHSLGMRACIGIGDYSDGSNDLKCSITHAREALRWAGLLTKKDALRVSRYREIEQIRGLPGLIGEMTPSITAITGKLTAVTRYDQEHGSQLFDTLRVFANQGGSVVHSAEHLYIHRNTLRQRLDRIEQILGEELPLGSDWTELAIATRM